MNTPAERTCATCKAEFVPENDFVLACPKCRRDVPPADAPLLERMKYWRMYCFGVQDADALMQEASEEIQRQQARIDALMHEFCPEEMTVAQLQNWAQHQRPVTEMRLAGVIQRLSTLWFCDKCRRLADKEHVTCPYIGCDGKLAAPKQT